MPKAYEEIKAGIRSKSPHLSDKEAKTRAARIYVGGGKTKAERSRRAKQLRD